MDTLVPAVVIVISDKFSRITELNLPEVITYSSFIDNLDSGYYHTPTMVSVGQGLDDGKVQYLKQKIANEMHSSTVFFVGNAERKIHKHIVHKEKDSNVSITYPVFAFENQYESVLSIDENCSEMDDHVTGVHVQGMLLVESARQMIIATIEQELIRRGIEYDFSYVLKNLDIEYLQYLFPVSAKITCTINSLTVSEKNILDANLDVSFYQAGKCVCIVHCSGQGFSKEKLKVMEYRMAKQCIRSEGRAFIENFNTANVIPETISESEVLSLQSLVANTH